MIPPQRSSTLDNPVWHSLQEDHKQFALTYGNLKCYHPDVCPFGGYEGEENIASAIDEYATLANNFFIVGEKPEFSDKLILKKELICLQMVIDRRMDVSIRERIVRLNDDHKDELVELVNLVQPGYFRDKTPLLGDYFGIFKDEMLVSVTGERMKTHDFTEVSAIVTHPEHTGLGYAKQLIAYAVNNIFDQHKTPYLHVAQTNAHAIALYERSGFKTRRKISFWNFAV
ncbi:MAG TPA: GNAT family N-acetyltransferase [Chitinophagaceae bacterium]|nr:GNAT family N-acetyltransferase [Chitinophagaceae bacterium]